MLHLEQNPIIAAVRTEEELLEAVKSPVEIIFLLRSSILTLQQRINVVHEAKKLIFVHADLAEGIGNDREGVGYLKHLGVAGIISTRTTMIRYAKEWGLGTVQRFFIVDSHSIDTAVDTIRTSRPDMIEIMPGVLYKIIQKFRQNVQMPVIAGGLVQTKKEVMESLDAGASAISTGCKVLWYA